MNISLLTGVLIKGVNYELWQGSSRSMTEAFVIFILVSLPSSFKHKKTRVIYSERDDLCEDKRRLLIKTCYTKEITQCKSRKTSFTSCPKIQKYEWVKCQHFPCLCIYILFYIFYIISTFINGHKKAVIQPYKTNTWIDSLSYYTQKYGHWKKKNIQDKWH